MSEAIIAKKAEQVAIVADKMKAAASIVVVDSRGLTVDQDTVLRRNLRESGVEFKVIKNSILSRAAEKAGLEDLKKLFVGPSAVAFSNEDVIAPAKVISEFAKGAEALEIKAGVVEGTYYDEAGMKAVAAVPSREELLSKLLGSLQSPITNLARVLNQIAEKGGAADAAVEAAPAEETAAAEEPAETPAE